MSTIDERREWNETVRASRQSRPDAWPPPVTQAAAPPIEHDTEIDLPMGKIVSGLARKLGPWLAIFGAVGGAIIGAASWFFSAGQRAADIPTKAEIQAVSSADIQVHKDTDAKIGSLNTNMASMLATMKAMQETQKDIKDELKELRLRTPPPVPHR